MTPDDRERRLSLISDHEAGRPVDKGQLEELERRHHAFDLMCRRSAPLNPVVHGFRWDEEIRHPAMPGRIARIRGEGCVSIAGVVMTLMEATRAVAAEARRGVALADWHGPSGRLGDLAGLEHPRRGEIAPPSRPDDVEDADESHADLAVKTETKPGGRTRASPAPAAIGDLFG